MRADCGTRAFGDGDGYVGVSGGVVAGTSGLRQPHNIATPAAHIYLYLDGDHAGITAARKATQHATRATSICAAPPDQDACDLAQHHYRSQTPTDTDISPTQRKTKQ